MIILICSYILASLTGAVMGIYIYSKVIDKDKILEKKIKQWLIKNNFWKD